MDVSTFGSLGELMIQVAVVVVLAATTGFMLGRWFYRSEAASRSAILQQEIMRLRRRVADGDRAVNEVRRASQRERRKSKRIPELDGLGI
jgi:Tfp pilus assembly protein PilN